MLDLENKLYINEINISVKFSKIIIILIVLFKKYLHIHFPINEKTKIINLTIIIYIRFPQNCYKFF